MPRVGLPSLRQSAVLIGGLGALLAFGGAMAATMFVYILSWQPGLGTSPMRMVLAGVAVTSPCSALSPQG